MEVKLGKIVNWLQRVNWEMKIRYTELKYRKDSLSPDAIRLCKENINAMGQLKTDVITKLIKDGHAVVDSFHTINDKDYYYILVGGKTGFHVPVTKETEEIFYLDENEHRRDL